MEIFDKIAEVCRKVVYIALASILTGFMLSSMAARVQADDVDWTGPVAPPATVIVEADETTGLTKVTVYIRTFIKDVQDKYREIVHTDEVSETAEAPKAS